MDKANKSFKAMLSGLLLNKKRHARYIAGITCMALLVVFGVGLSLRQNGVTLTRTETVLNCQYNGNGAHTHDSSCYDADGNLVCPLQERPLHVHTQECYATERVLACGLEESDGHQHTDECYDADGNLTCTIPEGEGAHQHTDECYRDVPTDELICGLEEVTEQHVHTDACFRTVTVEEPDPEPEPQPMATEPEPAVDPEPAADPQPAVDPEPTPDPQPAVDPEPAPNPQPAVDTDPAPAVDPEPADVVPTDPQPADPAAGQDPAGPAEPAEPTYPKQEFEKRFLDAEENEVLRVDVEAPEGALPEGTTMVAEWVDPASVQRPVERVVAAKDATREVWYVQGVRITFYDRDGKRIQPLAGSKVTITVTSSLVDTADDAAVRPYVLRLQDDLHKEITTEEEDAARPAEVLERLSEEQLAAREVSLGSNQLAFDAQYFCSDDFAESYLVAYTTERAQEPVADEPEADEPADDQGEPADGQGDEPADDGEPADDQVDDTEDEGDTPEGEDPADSGADDPADSGADDPADSEDGDEPDNPEPADPEPAEPSYPAQSFKHRFSDRSGSLVLRVEVEAPEGAFPVETSMVATWLDPSAVEGAVTDAVAQENFDKEVASIQAVDITFYDRENNPIEPRVPIVVTLTSDRIADESTESVLVHVDDAGAAEVVSQLDQDQLDEHEIAPADDQLVFESDAFSVYAIAYTVDFHYEVNGESFEYSLAGGSYINLADLVDVLDIACPSRFGETTNPTPEEFVANVASARFSTPELVWVGKSDENTTVGGLKVKYALDCEYSAEMTEEQAAAIDASEVKVGDWILISLKPFLTEETLTVTMNNGDAFTIRVTDAQIKKTVLDAKGDAWEITVTYDDSAEIPDGAELVVSEIPSEDKKYDQYYRQSIDEIGVVGTEDGESSEGSDSTSDVAENMTGSTAKSDSPEDGRPAQQAVEYARVFDIQIWADGHEIQPKSPVVVNIELKDAPTETDATPKVVHFAKEGPELMELNSAAADGADIRFVTDEFSVYSVVYTVDFHWEYNGEVMTFSFKGGDVISFAKLAEEFGLAESYIRSYDEKQIITTKDESGAEDDDAIESAGNPAGSDNDANENSNAAPEFSNIVNETTKRFIAQVKSVEFSNPELIWIEEATEDTATWKIMTEHDLDLEYAEGTTDQDFCKIYNRTFAAPDWILLLLKPFDTTETLKVTMKTGEVIEITVTDAQDAPMIDDGQGGQVVQTINNPNGTTIDLFDYWITNGTRNNQGMDGWPGHTGDAFNSWNFDWYDYYGNKQDYGQMSQDPNRNNDWYVNNGYLRGNGNNQGINSGHVFKFYPGAAGTVVDNGYKEGHGWTNNHDYYTSINSWTGTADPTVGLVQPYLNGQGYPQLAPASSGLGTDGSSLNYLFDTNDHAGKQRYPGVNNLLYVDPDGYYTYDSWYYSALLNNDGQNFTLREHSSSAQQAQRGFWPFGDRVNWHGMHMTTEFSMPANGQVLNPKGVYKDMEFEFHGDDDTWLYIDGILVGDGGGIHNHTKININFRTGNVLVTGTDDPVADHIGTYTSNRWLDDIFRSALAAQGKTQAEIDAYMAENFDGHTFKQGSKHTFEMFYLERGGSESNLYIHYNLVSTTDFSAHKSYYMLQDDPHARLERDQFKFELIGYDNTDLPSGFQQAIMPVNGTPDGAGTYASPKEVHYEPTADSEGYTSLIIGVTEDGNVNFGNIQVQASQAGMTYRYMVREVVDPDAVNADGVAWRDATEEERAEGGFVDANGVTYDNKVYYFTGTVQETSPGSGKYELKKTRYTDETYTKIDTKTKFFSFVNGHVEPLTLKVLKKSDIGDIPLDGAQFSLTKAHHIVTEGDEGEAISRWVPKDGAVPRTGSTTNGALTFDNLREGHYILEETAAPEGYEPGETTKWLLTITKVEEGDEIDLVPTITPLLADGSVDGPESDPIDVDEDFTFQYEVLNGKPPINISVEKQWYDNGDTTIPADATATFELHRVRNVTPITVELLDVQGDKICDVTAFVGDVIKIGGTFRFRYDAPANYSIWNGNNTRNREDSVSPNDGEWTIRTVFTYEDSGGMFWDPARLVSAVSTSSGQYTVDEQHIVGGKVQLRLGRYTRNYFDQLPVLYNATNSSVGTDDEVIETFTLPQDGDPGNPWHKTFSDLPAMDEQGNDYHYYLVETGFTPSEYDHQSHTGDMGDAGNPLSGSSDIVVTNSTAVLPKIEASKVWKDENGNPIDVASGLDGLEVKLTLYKGGNPAPANEVKGGADNVTQVVAGNGTAAWFLLDEHGDVTQYSVRETAVRISGGDFIDVTSENPFGGTVTGDSTNGYTVTNQLPDTEISVTKQWKDGTAANADKIFSKTKTITFTLYQKVGNNDPAICMMNDEPVTRTVTYTPASGGTAASWSTETISNLPKYVYQNGSWQAVVYYPVETAIDGVAITYAADDGTPSATPADAAISSGTVTIINTDIVIPIDIVKVDGADMTTKLPKAIFKLTELDPDQYGSYKNDGVVMTSLETNGNGETSFANVGNGYYEVSETQPPDGYILVDDTTFYIRVHNGEVTLLQKDPNSFVKDWTGRVLTDGEKLQFDNVHTFTVGNQRGTALPEAGGPGTHLFGIFGSVLICAGLMYGITSRRKARKEVA